ncbi:unnamed protein product [Cunninghamella blakesleeana]
MSDNSSSLFTCISCQVAFETAEAQRLHYSSDWHRYNLKRKVVNLPPISSELFQQKENLQKETKEKAVEVTEFKGYCNACRKSFASENQYKNHVQSKKHKENQVKYEAQPKKQQNNENKNVEKEQKLDMTFTEETTEEEIMSKIDAKIKAAPKLEEADCLFCSHSSATFEENIDHMTLNHSFFIPDIEFLVDIRGLVRYLGEKITVGNVCIYCNTKSRSYYSMDAVRKHMIDKGHCKIAYEEDDDAAELVDFYDFSTSYPQHENEEDIDVDAELGELTNSLRLADDELSLILPSGAVIGNRHMKRYYDQKLKPEETRDSVLINRLIGHYSDSDVFESLRSLHSNNQHRRLITNGKHGLVKSTEAFKEKRVHQDYRTRVGLQANKLQKYYREQII